MEEASQLDKSNIYIDDHWSDNVDRLAGWRDFGGVRTRLIIGIIMLSAFVFVAAAALYVVTGYKPSDVISELRGPPSGFLSLTPTKKAEVAEAAPQHERFFWISRYKEAASNKIKRFIYRDWIPHFHSFSISSWISDFFAKKRSVVTGLVKTEVNDIQRKIENKVDDIGQKNSDVEAESVAPLNQVTEKNVNSVPSFAGLISMNMASVPLTPGPVQYLLRKEPSGLLPIVVGDQSPSKIYARHFENNEHKPMIAIVITGLGLVADATIAAIDKMPPDITLSFSPYGNYPKGKLDLLIKKARLAGHEVLLDMPMEPRNLSTNDPGPMAILADERLGEVIGRMDLVMSQGTSYVGLAASLNSPVTKTGSMNQIVHNIQERGLYLLTDMASDEHVIGHVSMVLDENPVSDSINTNLSKLVSLAQKDGIAIAYLSAQPVSFTCLQSFLQKLPEQNVVLAPVSAVIGLKNE